MTIPGPQRQISRRSLLAAALAVPLLAACGHDDEPFSSVAIPRVGQTSRPTPRVIATSGRLTSKYWPGYRPTWILMRPVSVARPPLVVSLHGKGDDARSTFAGLGLQRFVASTGLAVASIDGGDYYWHARRSESTGYNGVGPDTPPCDTGAMVTRDFVPMLAGFGLDTARLGYIGWSMGGYGALLLAATNSPKARAVAPMSAALWTEPGYSAPGAFDDAEDWERNNVFAMRSHYAGIPIRLAVGTSDPFYQADTVFVDGFPDTSAYDVKGVYGPGGHDDAFWASHAGAQMGFLAQHLNG